MILEMSLVKMHKRLHLANEEIKNWIRILVQATIAQKKVKMWLDLVLQSQILEIKAAGSSQKLIQMADPEHINKILVTN